MSDWLEIGKIVAAQGLKGEVRVYPDSDFPERFEQPGQRWLLRPGATEPEPVELRRGRYLSGKNLYVLQFAEVTNRDQAESLRGAALLVPESDRPALEEDEFHVVDLIGLEVYNQYTQTVIGTVVDVIPAGNDLLEVELTPTSEAQAAADPSDSIEPLDEDLDPETPEPKTVLIPFVKAIAPIVDLDAKRIEITPPAGLIE